MDAYVAPHTGGESFGIVLVEAMAGGAPVVCSDLNAFVDVLGEPPAGVTFASGDADALVEALADVLDDADTRSLLRGRGRARAEAFDWRVVAEKIMAVYDTVIESAELAPDEQAGRVRDRLRRIRSGRRDRRKDSDE